jgi:hypothetical protein
MHLERIALGSWESCGRGTESILTFLIDLEVIECGHARAGRLAVLALELSIVVAE